MYAQEWMRHRAYMNLEPNEFNALFYYLAALTAEVAKGHSKKGAKGTKTNDRLIKFVLKKKRVVPVVPKFDDDEDKGIDLPPEVRERMIASKRTWFAAAGLNSKGELKGK